MQLLHRFSKDISGIEPPLRFNNPFYYIPHRLCEIAADEVRSLLADNTSLEKEARKGKMFGVLVVRDRAGRLGFLAAFSGLLCGSNNVEGFVPPVYDLLSPGGYFKQKEAKISILNERIKEVGNCDEYTAAVEKVQALQQSMEKELSAMRESMRESKLRRSSLRATGTLSPAELEALVRESQFQKAELKRATARWRQEIACVDELLKPLKAQINAMKEERKRRSAELQRWLFSQYAVLNGAGEEKSLLDIFAAHSGIIPPGGSGECAAPKLLQYAYRHRYTPLAMAEFWVGDSPAGEVRRDGCFYGSCKSKCEPILGFMLQGLDVEENALERGGNISSIDVVYEDEHIVVVDKPSGVLSVPGVVGGMSVQQWLREEYLKSNELYVVHRLDMATSGLLVAAKSMEVYKAMQGIFAMRGIRKKYMALLDGVPSAQKGTINIPLAADYNNRPRQKVDYEHGKEAVTCFEQLGTMLLNGKECAVVQFEPLTGRTHQLRVHAACKEGLDCPIVGDALYGVSAGRLMLHASGLEFSHPVSGELLKLVSAAPFT